MTSYRPVPGPQGPQGTAGVDGVDGAIGPPGPIINGIGRHYAYIDAANKGYTSPDAAGLDFTTGVSLRMLLLPDTWTPGANQVLVSKWTVAGNQRSYQMNLTTTGQVQFQFSPDGIATVTLNSNPTVPNVPLYSKGAVWIRVDGFSNDGTGKSYAQFYYSLTNTATWVQIGTTVTNATPGPFFASTATMAIGQQSNGTAPYTGRFYELDIYDPSGPTLVAHMDARDLSTGTDDYVDTTGTLLETWTHMSGTTIFTDEISDYDFLDASLGVSRLIPDASGKFLGVSAGRAAWVALPGNSSTMFSIADQGAVGDGVTDDRAAIQAAITLAKNASGGTVFFPPPTSAYLISAAIDLNACTNVYLRSNGWHQSKVAWKANAFLGTTTTDAMVLVRGSSTGCTVDGLELDGNRSNHPHTTVSGAQTLSTTPSSFNVISTAHFPATGTFSVPTGVGPGNPNASFIWKTVTYTGISGNTFTGCTITTGSANAASGATVVPGEGGLGINITAGCSDIRVQNMLIHDTPSTCVFMAGVDNVKIRDSTLRDNGYHTLLEASETGSANGVRAGGASTHVEVTGCFISGMANSGMGVVSTGGSSQYISYRDNIVKDCGFIGIAGGPTNNDVIVSDNRISGCTNNGIDMGGCQQWTVSGNTVEGGRTGIDVDGGVNFTSYGGTIAHNAVRGSTARYGIAAVRFHNVTIIGNTVDSSHWDGINTGSAAGNTPNAVVSGNFVRNSGQDGSGTRNGIHLNNTIGATVVGNICTDDQSVPTQQYGVKSEGASDYVALSGNMLHGNVAGAYSLVGANNQVSGVVS